MKAFLTLLALLSAAVSYDRTVHDFGTVPLSSGPLTCTFTVTNSGDEPMNIYAVITTCGCTSVKWTRTDIAPGGKGTIEVTYTNDEGPYPFDKTLKVYTSCEQKPRVLHIKGNPVKDKKK